MNTETEGIGERVKILRKTLGLTQQQFAERILVSKSYISKVESGNEVPSDVLTKLIALEFNINYLWLRNDMGKINLGDSLFDAVPHDYQLSNLVKVQNELFEKVVALNRKHAEMHIENIQFQLCGIIDLYKERPSMCDTIVNEIASCFHNICEIIVSSENLDMKSPSYLNELYGIIRKYGGFIQNDLNDIGDFYAKEYRSQVGGS